jgi:hypothetical protein
VGLGRFTGFIANMHTLRRRRAWCGDCFCDARDSDVPAHLQLVWSLEEYQRCIFHGQVLETQCTSCGKHSDPSNSWSRAIDHCPWCDSDLAKRRMNRIPSFGHLARRNQVESDMHASKLLSAFVADASTMEQPSTCDVAWSVSSAKDRGIARNASEIADQAHLSKSSMSTAIRGLRKVTLAGSLRIASACQVPLAALFSTSIRELFAAGKVSTPAALELPGNAKKSYSELGSDPTARRRSGLVRRDRFRRAAGPSTSAWNTLTWQRS